jgi:tetratricopeptide (TPR) repeat protein
MITRAIGAWTLGACLAVLALQGGAVRAQASPTATDPTTERREPTEAELAEARHSFDVGTRAYDAGEYATAAAEFREAYELTRHPDLLYNVYLAEERAGRIAEARDALERHLADATIDPEHRALLERRLTRLRARVEAPPGSAPTESADGEAAPLPHDEDRDARLRDLMRDTLATETARARREATEDATAAPRAAAVGLMIGAGVLAVSFAVFAALSEVEDQSIASECGRDRGAWCDAGRLSTLEAYNIAADVSWITAAVVGAIGVTMFLALPAPSPEGAAESAADVAVLPLASPSVAGLTLAGRFR